MSEGDENAIYRQKIKDIEIILYNQKLKGINPIKQYKLEIK